MKPRTLIVVLVSAIIGAGILVSVIVGLTLTSQPSDPFWACMMERGFDPDEPLRDSGHTMPEFQAAGDECEALTGSDGVPAP